MKLPDFELERYFARWEFEAPQILCASDVETMRLADLLALADAETRLLWENLSLGYTESPGHLLLRTEVSRLYQTLDPDQVLVFAGAEEAIFILSNVLLGHGDHAVVVWPAYQSLYEVGRSTGAEITLLRLDESNGWALDLDELKSALRPNTRLITVNFPHNPTGATIGRSELQQFVEIAEDAGITLLSDEVYRLSEYDDADRLPPAADLSPHAVSLGVMSKAFGLAGLRIGWLACQDKELLRRCASFKDYTTICSSGPSELLALIGLRAAQPILQRNREIVARNLAMLDAFLGERADLLSWVRPRAGCIGFPRLNDRVDVDSFARELVESCGVLILPGSVFGDRGNHFRIGFGRSDFPEGLARIDGYLARAK